MLFFCCVILHSLHGIHASGPVILADVMKVTSDRDRAKKTHVLLPVQTFPRQFFLSGFASPLSQDFLDSTGVPVKVSTDKQTYLVICCIRVLVVLGNGKRVK